MTWNSTPSLCSSGSAGYCSSNEGILLTLSLLTPDLDLRDIPRLVCPSVVVKNWYACAYYILAFIGKIQVNNENFRNFRKSHLLSIRENHKHIINNYYYKPLGNTIHHWIKFKTTSNIISLRLPYVKTTSLCISWCRLKWDIAVYISRYSTIHI